MNNPVRNRAKLAAGLLRKLGGLAVLLTFAAPAAAQGGGQVSGSVTSSSNGAPVAGATVSVVGTNLLARTGPDGRYTLTSVPPGTQQVRVARLGYATATQSVSVSSGATATADFRLAGQAVVMDSLVAVGYTTQRRTTVSDAVAEVSAAQLQDRQVGTVEEALRGQVAGVNIVSTGEPGRGSQVIIRGQNFLGGASPLYVVDGMYTRQNLSLNPEDIESIQVLKDASAAAQYGAQSANGVIVITTRRGRTGAPRVSVNSYYGVQDVPRRVELVGGARWAEINRMARENSSDPSDNVPASGYDISTSTDWQGAVFQQGAVQDHNFSVSGGSTTASYLIGGGYFQQQGTIIDTDFERFSFRANSEIRTGRWRLGENLSLSRFTRNNIVGFPLIDAVRLQPAIPVRDPNNSSGYGYGSGNGAFATFGTNPVGAFERETNRDFSNRLLGNLFAEFAITGQLRYRLNLGIDYEDLNWNQFVGRRQIRQNTVPTFNEGTDRRDSNMGLLMEHLLNYENLFGDHSITAVAGITDQTNTFERLSAYGRNFPNENLTQIDQATSDFDNTAYEVPSALRGLLFRANYAFQDKYLLTGSFRRDGSSRFGAGNKYGNFFSGSAGWVLSEEDFFQGIPVLGSAADFMKLRVSYGSLGNQDIGDFENTATIQPNQSYVFGNTIATGATQVSLANPNIRWQDQTQVNVGMDVALMSSALRLNADYYVSKSDGLLVNAPIPWSLGASGAPRVNAGSVRNSGFEFGAEYSANRGALQLTAGANLTTINNEVTALGNGGQPLFAGFNNISRTTVGGSIGEFFVLKTDGIFQSQADVQAHVNSAGQRIQPNAMPGDIRYADLNDDGVINDDDRYVAGDPVPDLETGMHLNATYHRINFGLAMRGSFGAKVFNVARFWTDRMDENSNYRADLNPWTPDNTNTTDPRPVFGAQGADNARANTDRWIEDASYLRIQNIVLGYALPRNLFQRFGVTTQGTRLYVNVQNAYTFTGFSNWDPEINTGDPLARGIDDGRIYPNPRTLTVGIDLNL